MIKQLRILKDPSERPAWCATYNVGNEIANNLHGMLFGEKCSNWADIPDYLIEIGELLNDSTWSIWSTYPPPQIDHVVCLRAAERMSVDERLRKLFETQIGLIGRSADTANILARYALLETIVKDQWDPEKEAAFKDRRDRRRAKRVMGEYLSACKTLRAAQTRVEKLKLQVDELRKKGLLE